MLNALRHQRLLHMRPLHSWIITDECSTPCGIKDYCTLLSGYESLSYFLVLNALRHQRLLHCPANGPRHLASRVLNALRHQRLLHRPLWLGPSAGLARAQRLSASKITARVASSVPCTVPVCAQRLAASKITAPPYPH